ncbi:restriction endonuclease subunit S [Streptomyces sp. NPDC002734]|uniref:restriction endonuclease subunit S n=1 Tax=Streptomyces sp. NPDC002734 TaxID=3154426 RepID=UPI0033346E59
MPEWQRRQLGDLCTRLTVGHVGPMASRYKSSGIPFLRSLNIKRGRVDLSAVKYIDEKFHSELAKSQIKPGDLAIVRTGEPGVAAIIPDTLPVANCSDLVIATPKPDVDGRFLCYAINETAQDFVKAHTVGAVQQHFNVKSAKVLEINLPPLHTQRAISELLGALDNKIAVNERIARKADELSREIFQQALLASPANFTDCALSEAAEFINGRAFTKDATGTGRMVIRIAEINSGPGASTVYNDIEVPDKHIARPGDVLFAWSGSLTVARWYRPEAIINQHIFKCIPRVGYPDWLVSQLLHGKIDEFRAIAAGKATTMGHIQRKHLDDPVSVPESEELVSLDRQISPLWDSALLAERESLTLATLRDTILPQLMSGRLRVKTAEKIVEDAT